MSDYIFGLHAVLKALEGKDTVSKLLIDKGINRESVAPILSFAKQRSVLVQWVPAVRLQKFGNKNHQGVLAYVSPIVFVDYQKALTDILEKEEEPLVLILDRITDVRNFGAIVRTAEASGVHLIVVPTQGRAAIQADAVKTSSGALFHMPIAQATHLKDVLFYLKESDFKIIAASEKAKHTLYEESLKGPLALIMGSEENGVHPSLQKLCDNKVKLPMFGKTESLNVSVATGIFLYEVLRQRAK